MERETVHTVLGDRLSTETVVIKRVNEVLYKGESYGAFMITRFKLIEVKKCYVNKRGQFVVLVY